MAIATEIARLQDAKVDIMAALVEKGVDVTGKKLVDVPDLIDSIEVGPKTVRIGEHDYPYVKIGNLYWTARNLMEDVGSSVWYNNDEATYRSYGKLYNWNDIYQSNTIRDLLPDGWRVPNDTDLQTIKGMNKSQLDDVGFNMVYAGAMYNGTSFGDINRAFKMYSNDTSGGDVRYYEADTPTGTFTSSGYTNKNHKFSVRLVKDA